MRPSTFAFLLGAAVLGLMPAASAQEKGGVIDVATIGEPPTLDAMVSSTDIVGMISQHIFETLFTFDSDWNVAPLLAKSLPTISDDARTYTITLRDGVKFHDGSVMAASDVVASLKRWMVVGGRGKQVAENVASVEAVDGNAIQITLKEPYSPLLSLLAFNNSAAIIIPEKTIPQDGGVTPLATFVGTGPYKLQEHKPDQYIQLVRFDDYSMRDEEPSGFAGARHAYLDEIRFVPVPDINTRTEGAIAGQFAFADTLPVESYERLEAGKSEPVLLEHFGWPIFVMNTKEGLLSDMRVRQALQAALNTGDMLAAAFGDTKFYAVDGPMYPANYAWRTDVGVELYNQGNAEKAKELLAAAGYDGKPLRILTSRQYEFHYKMALVAQAYLEQAGFKVDMQVVDWATLVQRNKKPDLWEIFITHSPFLPEPALNFILSKSAGGWWDSPEKEKAMAAFTSTSDLEERKAHWEEIQKLIFEQAPIVKVGDFASLSAKSPALEGFRPSPWPAFWNVSLNDKQ
ncbi:ABC transporter substrate-binding protein [Nitratireductor pacificus]|uniref:ABC transporter substrate binding protein (Dipeptide) n=1 Tax=Nitratireductor pacificus pht-3B TaxID=391937 RepID=K2MH21_9HYPH|nr:ABC transporter substrate-binding protein [Nitratireductor pacificus]EKF20015.1 ABC transporter substrate binding protein (dipeptide) [Nitratireductor pacificus pht-3B]